MPVKNGYVPTPPSAADLAVRNVFELTKPDHPDQPRLLLPGLGTGRLYNAVHRYCASGTTAPFTNGDSYPLPEIVAVEKDYERIREFYAGHPDPGSMFELVEGDFLTSPPSGRFDWVVMNPPFVRYNRLPAPRREWYGEEYWAALGQFGLFVPFVEQALRLLRPGGELITFLPDSAWTSKTCKHLRMLWRQHSIDYVELLPVQTFPVKVQTLLVSFKKQPDDELGTTPYITYQEPYDLRYILADVMDDPTDEAIETALDEYYDQYEHYRGLMGRVNSRDDDADLSSPPTDLPPGATESFTEVPSGPRQAMLTSYSRSIAEKG